MRLIRGNGRCDEAGGIAPSALAPAAIVVGLVVLAAVLILLSGLIGGAPIAVIALSAGAGAGWFAEKLVLRLNYVVAPTGDPMGAQIQRQLKSIKRLAIYDPNTALYHRWYFELRLAEELHRCQRYGLSMAVLYLRLGKMPSDPTFGMEGGAHAPGLAQITSHVVRSVDLLAHMDESEYAICLPHSDAEGAEAAVSRLVKELKDYDAEIGYAVYPADAADSDSLVACARERAVSTVLRQVA